MSIIDSSAEGFLNESIDFDRYGHEFSPYGAAGLICGMTPLGSRVLDVGCGNGTLAEILRRHRNSDILGIEPDLDRAAVARSRGFPVVTGYLTDEVCSTLGKFDVVMFADVLEHVSAPFRLLQLGRRCLNNRGQVVISVPNIAHWSVRSRLLAGRFEYEPYGIMDATHLRWFTRKTAIDFLRRAGFSPIEVRATAGTNLNVYRRWPWKWLPRRAVWHTTASLSRLWPTMFGCQIVIRSTQNANSAYMFEERTRDEDWQ